MKPASPTQQKVKTLGGVFLIFFSGCVAGRFESFGLEHAALVLLLLILCNYGVQLIRK